MFERLLIFCLLFAATALPAETFQNPRHLVVPGGANLLGSADFNGDGLPDFYSVDQVTNLYTNPHLNIELALPGNTYTAPISVVLPVQTPICRAADLNNDHRADLICISGLPGTAPAIVNILIGNGDGTFQTPRTISFNRTVQRAGFSMAFYAAGDTNGDGHTDFIIIDGIGNQILTFLGDGTGNFPSYKSLALPNDFAPGETIAQLADVNHDGKLDLLLGGPIVFFGVGDGSFLLPNSLPPTPDSLCSFADMDADGQLDSVCLVSASGPTPGSYVDSLTILHGRPDGTFDPNPIASIPLLNSDFTGPAFIRDINGDHIPDIIAHSTDGMSVLLGDPGLTFSPPVHYNFYNLGGWNPYQPDTTLFADFNGDGLLDIAAPGVNGIFITYGRPDGTFDAGPIVQSGDTMGFAVVGDFNGDGIPDVVSSGTSTLFFDSGNGDGTFKPAVPIPTQTSTFVQQPNTYLIKGDFNGDGKPDLLIQPGSLNTAVTSILFNRGNGSFQPPVSVTLPAGVNGLNVSRTIAVADVNGDGRDDLLTGTFDPYNQGFGALDLLAYLSNGDGTFNIVATPVPSGRNGSSYYDSAPAVADLNGDGKVDVVLPSNDTVQILLGEGNGKFNLGTPVPVPNVNGLPVTYIPAVVTGDFDRDGHQDFAVLATSAVYSTDNLDFGPTALLVFYGHGDGTFDPGVVAGTLDHGYLSLATADFNHDGLADFVMSTNDGFGGLFDLDAIAVLHGQPNRTFSTETNLIGGQGISLQAVADFNRDGSPDLLFNSGGFGAPSVGRGNDFTILLNHPGPYVQGTLTAAPEPSIVGQPFSLSALLTPYGLPNAPTGSVAFTIDGSPVGSASLNQGTATLPITQTYARGDHTLTAIWPGDTNFPGLTLAGTHHISGLPVVLTLTANPNPSPIGSPVQLTAVLSNPPGSNAPAPTGTISLSDNGSPFATLAASGGPLSTLTTVRAFASAGPHTLSATYSGDSLHDPFTTTLVESVSPLASRTTLASTPNPSTFAQTVTLTASVAVSSVSPIANPIPGATFTLSGLPGGAITAPAVLSQSGAANVNTASATYRTSSLPAGAYTLTASFSGNPNTLGSTSATITQTVLPAPTSLTLSSTPNPAYQGQTVSLVAHLTAAGPATGSIRILDGSSVLATIPLGTGATASLGTSSLSVGQHILSAAYLGDNNELPSTAPPIIQTILPSDFALSTGPTAPLTLLTGHHTTFQLSVQSIGAFSDSVTLSAGILPQYATMQFHPAQVALTPGSTSTVSVYFDTDAVLGFYSGKIDATPLPARDALPLALAGTILLLFPRKRRRFSTLLTLLAAAILFSTALGCADRYPGSVAPGNYILHLTGTAAHSPLTHTIDLPLTVKSR